MARPPLPIGAHGSISTTLLGSGLHRSRTRFRDADGVTREITALGRSKAAAERDLKTKCADRAAMIGSDDLNPDTTIEALGTFWLKELDEAAKIEQTTIDEYRRLVVNTITPAIGGIRLRELTNARIERLLKEIESANRRKKVRSIMSRMLDLAVRHDAYALNPIRSMSPTEYSAGKPEAYSDETLDEIRHAIHLWMNADRPGPKAKTDMLDIVDLLLATGCRIGEILALRWSEVHLAPEDDDDALSTVAITGTIKTVRGEGTYRKPKPKSKSSDRLLVLPPFAVAMLRRRLNTMEPNIHDAVFCTRVGTWHQVSNINRRWRAIREGTGFSEGKIHQFRKTVATLVDERVDAETAAKQLGHSSKDVTEMHYIDRAPKAVDNSAVLQAHAPKRKFS